LLLLLLLHSTCASLKQQLQCQVALCWVTVRPGCQADEVGDKRVARGQLRGPSVGQEVQGGEALSEAEGTCVLQEKKR